MSAVPQSVRFREVVLRSPYFLLIFLVIPALIIAGRYLPLPRFLPITTKLILANNLCLLACIAYRFVLSLAGVRQTIRYGSQCRVPRTAVTLDRPAGELRQELSGDGYRFDASGSYAEKPDFGYLGTTLLYGGLLFLLAAGTWANLTQFSGTILLGVGQPVSLGNNKAYGKLILGPLASPKGLPQIQVRKQIMPNATYPKGATDIAVLDQDRKVLVQGVIEPYKPLHYRDFDINMAKFVLDASVTIKTADDKKFVFTDFVKLMPLVQKKGAYSHYAGFDNGSFRGDLYYDPALRKMQVLMSKDGKPVFDTDIVFQQDAYKVQGAYRITIDKLGQWTEIHVSRGRHTQPMIFGAILAVLGLLVRLLVPSRRVWLEEVDGGKCKVKTVGRETKKLIGCLGA